MKNFALFAVLLSVAALPAGGAAQAARHPTLVVFIAVDQMRGDYPVRYAPLLSKGLVRLTTKGAWYQNAAYPYLTTVTCAGHSTLGTGTFPYKHGMMQNVWYDRASGKTIACAEDPKIHDVIGQTTVSGPGDDAVHMEMPTLAEIMHRDLHSRVVTMSLKPRSAIGLGGHGGSDDFNVLWLDAQGQVETSAAYGPMVPAWASAFAKANPVSRDAGKTWVRSLPGDRYQYQDDLPGERPGGGWSALFPHALGAAGDPRYFAHWEESPYADEYLELLAEHAVDDLHLGQRDRTDFLGISFSALDHVGHAFGPRSQEIQDMLVRLDATLGRLLDHLDEKVGAGNYVLALSADHGVADVPEQIDNGGRLMSPTVTATIEAALKPAFGDGPFVAANLGNDIYLKPGVAARLASDAATFAKVQAAVEAMPGVARLLTAAEVSPAPARQSPDPQIRAAALSYYADRSGDLILIPKEHWIYGGGTTTHGTLYAYDQHVPMILYGAGIHAGVQNGAGTPADLAATLASLVSVHLPSPDGQILTAALAKPSGTSRR